MMLLGLVAAVVAWVIWGWWAALIAVVAAMALYYLAWLNTKNVAARNAVYAALTYRTLDAGQQGAVDGAVASICRRLGISVDSLGKPFPFSAEVDGISMSSPAAVFAFRSLAMHELGIPPVGTKLAKWYVLRNPFTASLAKSQVARYRKRVEADFNVVLDELDN